MVSGSAPSGWGSRRSCCARRRARAGLSLDQCPRYSVALRVSAGTAEISVASGPCAHAQGYNEGRNHFLPLLRNRFWRLLRLVGVTSLPAHPTATRPLARALLPRMLVVA